MATLGPLTTTFTPSGTGCQSIHVGITDVTFIQQGTISDCFPSNFVPQDGHYYSPGICPQSMAYACMVGVGLGSSMVTAATCCPRYASPFDGNEKIQELKWRAGRSNIEEAGLVGIANRRKPSCSGFTCRTTRESSDPNACISIMTSDSSYIVDVLAYTTGSPTKIGTTSVFRQAGEQVFAKGLVVWRAATDVEWPASATASATLSTTISLANDVSPTGPVTSASTNGIPEATSTDVFRNRITTTTTTVTMSGYATASGLSYETQVGLGVGISFSVLFFVSVVAAAYLVGKRRMRMSHDEHVLDVDSDGEKLDLTIPGHELEEQRRMVEMSSQREPVELMSSYH